MMPERNPCEWIADEFSIALLSQDYRVEDLSKIAVIQILETVTNRAKGQASPELVGAAWDHSALRRMGPTTIAVVNGSGFTLSVIWTGDGVLVDWPGRRLQRPQGTALAIELVELERARVLAAGLRCASLKAACEDLVTETWGCMGSLTRPKAVVERTSYKQVSAFVESQEPSLDRSVVAHVLSVVDAFLGLGTTEKVTDREDALDKLRSEVKAWKRASGCSTPEELLSDRLDRLVTDQDIIDAGLGDPSVCVDSPSLKRWLALYGIDDARLEGSAMAHDHVINRLAHLVGRPPLTVLMEIAEEK